LCCALLLVLLHAVAGAGSAQAIRASDSADKAVKYLQEDQNMDGGFGGEPGEASNPDFTAWVSLALAAAGVNPRSQMKPGGQNAYAYLLGHVGEMSATTDFERELLVVDAAGTSPHDFGGVDLVARLLERALQEPAAGGIAFPHDPGSTRAGMNDTIFAVIALSPVHEPTVEAAVQQATSWIEREQNKDGSWPAICPKTVPGCSPLGKEPEGEADMTAAAIEALNAAGRHHTTAQQQGLEYLQRTQNPSEGGFAEQLGGRASNADSSLEANVGSTAWVAQAVWAAGENPENWSHGGADPLTYIESMQQPDGHVRWMRSREMNGVWMTAYAGPALFGVPLPVPQTPYVPPPEPTKPGGGVDAGGGGLGAPLFSRPQPGSRGRTSGGARVLVSKHHKNRTRRRNPGPPRRSLVPTLAEETTDPTATSRARAHAASAKAPRKATGHGGSGGGAGTAKGHLSIPPPSPSAAGARREVKGVPIRSLDKDLPEPGAPGLRAAGQKPTSPVLAIAIAVVALMLALAGAAVEWSRPQVAP